MRRFRGDADVELGAAIDEHEGEKKGGGNCHKCEHTATKKSIRRIYKRFQEMFRLLGLVGWSKLKHRADHEKSSVALQHAVAR